MKGENSPREVTAWTEGRKTDCLDCLFPWKRHSNKIQPIAGAKSTEKTPAVTQASTLRETAKVTLIVMIPIVALLSMTSNALINSTRVYDESQRSQNTIRLSIQVYVLICLNFRFRT